MTLIRPAVMGDFIYIDSLRKREGDALGFIPKAVYQSVLSGLPYDGRRRWQYSQLNVTVDNDDLTGYCYATFIYPTAKIFQIVVQEDARRWQRALLLESAVRSEAAQRGMTAVTCRVAYDLESNFFWRAIGYSPVRQVVSTWLNQKESKSKRPLWEYHLGLDMPLFASVTSMGKDEI